MSTDLMRWAITGTGMITSLGVDRTSSFEAFCRGETGVKRLVHLEPSRFKLKRAYEIADGSPEDRATRWVGQAIGEALGDSGLDPESARLAVLVGTGLRELRAVEQWHTGGWACPSRRLHFAPAVEELLGMAPPVMTFSNACSASLFTLGLAEDLLRLQEADAVIVAGTDTITASMFGLVDRTNPEPPDCLAPFDRTRKGVLMGEGAAALVLETPEGAQERGREPLAWLRGVGMSCDAYHETVPERAGMLAAMQEAHRRAGTSPREVDLLFPHGTGTALNDATEALAIADLFGEWSGRVRMTALKSLVGHTSGASGLIAVVTAVECLRQGRIPPTLHVKEPIPEAAHFTLVTRPALASLRLAQVNAFGFGGVNAVALLERGEVCH